MEQRPIQCNEINQVIDELRIAFQTCKQIKPSDLTRMVELISAVNVCSNGGPLYNTIVSQTYEGPTIVTYPINSFHSFSMNVLKGAVEYQGFDFPRGSSRNIEFTTLNQTEITFKVNANSKMLIEYIIETTE